MKRKQTCMKAYFSSNPRRSCRKRKSRLKQILYLTASKRDHTSKIQGAYNLLFNDFNFGTQMKTKIQGRRNIFQHSQDRSCVNLMIFCFYSACCPVLTTDGAAIGFQTKVNNFCLFTFNDNIIRRQIRFLMYEIFIFFIIMLYYIFF